jgi:ketosteroid isomerase-like protein
MLNNDIESIVREFVNSINTHSVERMGDLITEDHTFTDSQNNTYHGKEVMLEGWKSYFTWFPDYFIEINELFVRGDTIVATGYASGTYKGIKTRDNKNHWRDSAAWKTTFEKGKIKSWQVYSDTKVAFEVIKNRSYDPAEGKAA